MSILSTPIPDCCTSFRLGQFSIIVLSIIWKPFTIIWAGASCDVNDLLGSTKSISRLYSSNFFDNDCLNVRPCNSPTIFNFSSMIQ